MSVRGLADQPPHHGGANAPPLEPGIHKQLRQEERIVLGRALQPANIRAVEHDYSNLCGLPPLAEADHLRFTVQLQFPKHPLYAGKI